MSKAPQYNEDLKVYSTGSGCLRALCEKGNKDGKKAFCLVPLDDYRELELKYLASLTDKEKEKFYEDRN